PAAGSPAPGASARSGSESGNGGRATETPAHPLNRIGRLFSRQEDFPSRSLPPAPPTPPRVNVMRDSAEQGPQLPSGTPVLSEPPLPLPSGSAPLSGGPGLVVTWTQSSPPAAPSPEAATGQAPSLATSPLAPAGISPEFPFATYSEEKPKRFRKP